MPPAMWSAMSSSLPPTESEPPNPGSDSTTTRCVAASAGRMRSQLLLSASSEWNSTMGAPLPPTLAARRLPATVTVVALNPGVEVMRCPWCGGSVQARLLGRVLVPVEGRVIQPHHHALGLEVLVEGFGAALAADARVAHAAPRRCGVQAVVVVDP